MLAYAYTTVIPREFIYLVFVATYALVLLVKTKLLLYVVVIPNDDLCLCLHLSQIYVSFKSKFFPESFFVIKLKKINVWAL